MWRIRTTVGSRGGQRQSQCREPSAIGKPDKLTDGSDPVVAAFCGLFFSALAIMQAVSFLAFGYFDAQNSLNLRSLSIVRLLSLPDASIWDW